MKDFLFKIKEKLSRLLYGIYGIDNFGYSIIVISLIFSFLSSLLGEPYPFLSAILYIASYAMLIYELFRFFSKNKYKRMNENIKFKQIFKKIKNFFKLQYNKLRDIRTHKYFVCPKCKNSLRVPRGKGDITITCPVCRDRFDRRS